MVVYGLIFFSQHFCSFEFILDCKRSYKVGAEPLNIPVRVLFKLKGEGGSIVVGGSKTPDPAIFVNFVNRMQSKLALTIEIIPP